MLYFYCVVCLPMFLLNLVTGIGAVFLSYFCRNGGGGVSLILASLPYPCISVLASLLPLSAVTPLQAQQFSWELRFHPNQQKVDFVLHVDGIHHGFKLCFCQGLKPA